MFILAVFSSLLANAQIYSRKQVIDKFDDVISEKTMKTLVSIDGISITIEEKGNTPQVYKFVPGTEVVKNGSKDEIVNLVDDVYGYEESWAVIPDEQLVECFMKRTECMLEEDSQKREEALQKVMREYVCYITHRVVVNKYTEEYRSEILWIRNNKDGGRTLYIKH